MNKELLIFFKGYGLCMMITSLLCLIYVFITGIFNDWVFVIEMNNYSEGWIELALLLLALPSIPYWFRKATDG